MTTLDLLDRLGRRGAITVTARDGTFDVRFKAPGPYQGRAWCTSDEADFWSYCHLGATNWHGEGDDLEALVTECEEATRPRPRDVDDLRFAIEQRRESRTYGPPLPSYIGWRGWRPGDERWLRAFDHAHEYLGGYLRNLDLERQRKADIEEAERRRRQHAARRILGGVA